MRHIFIDCGSHLGQSVREFMKTKIFSEHKWEIFCFEANPFLDHLVLLESPHIVNFQQKAVWVKNGTIPLYIDQGTSCEGSSVCESKTTGKLDKEHPVIVHCFDLSEWIQVNFDLKDEIILKMDIEGAEYDVLEKMIQDETIKYINTLFVEFHAEKIGIDLTREHRILQKLKEEKIRVITEDQAKEGYTNIEVKLFKGLWFKKSEKNKIALLEERVKSLEKRIDLCEHQAEWNKDKIRYVEETEINKCKTRINELKGAVKNVKFSV